MIAIIFVIVFTVAAVFQGKFIRKHNTKLYALFTILSIAAFITRYNLPITEPFVQGYLGFSFLYIVMVAGALKKGSTLRKKLMGVRREYSIIGFIIMSSHGLKYLIEFLRGDIRFEWLGVIPYVIMIPLFITSFMFVRKKFTIQTWKKIQQFAYIVYIFIFVHLIIVAELPNLAVYIVLFVPYIVIKPVKEFKKHQQAKRNTQ
jgi:DMSO/TMAO reductase YedYZ heme-binding membrane subunit